MAIMNCAQFSRATGWPLATVRRWCNLGIIRHVRLGRQMLFDDADGYFVEDMYNRMTIKKI